MVAQANKRAGEWISLIRLVLWLIARQNSIKEHLSLAVRVAGRRWGEFRRCRICFAVKGNSAK